MRRIHWLWTLFENSCYLSSSDCLQNELHSVTAGISACLFGFESTVFWLLSLTLSQWLVRADIGPARTVLLSRRLLLGTPYSNGRREGVGAATS